MNSMKLVRNTTLALCLLLAVIPMFAQDQKQETKAIPSPEEMNTLLKAPKLGSLGVYLVPEYQYGNMAGQFTSMGGVSLMVLFNQKLGVGFTAYGNSGNYVPKDLNLPEGLGLRSHFSGARIEYTLNPNKKIHFSFPMLIGRGQASIDSLSKGHRYGYGSSYHNQPHSDEISYLVIQPGVNLEFNVFRFMKVFGGASYRIVTNSHTHSSTTNMVEPPMLGDMQGLSLNAGIKLGYDFALRKK